MSEQLKKRLDAAIENYSRGQWETALGQMILWAQEGFHLTDSPYRHLEAQQKTPASASLPTEQPVPSSSEVTGTEEVMKPIWGTSRTWSYPASPAGCLEPSVLRDIVGWLSSAMIHGAPLGAEIGVSLTSKAVTPPAGSASQSTEEPTPAHNGLVGNSAPGEAQG